MPTPFDSILTRPTTPTVVDTLFYARGSSLPDTDVAGQLRPETFADDAWVAGTLLGMFTLLFIILCRNHDYLSYRIKDFFTTERRFADPAAASASGLPQELLLLLIGSGSLALIALHRLTLTGAVNAWTEAPWRIFLLLSGLILGFVLVKALLYELVDWVFFNRHERNRWMASYFFLTSIFAFLIFATATALLFTPFGTGKVSFCLLFLFIAYEILLYYRLATNFQTKFYGQLLIFLYFCTLEIVPALVAWHIFELSST